MFLSHGSAEYVCYTTSLIREPIVGALGYHKRVVFHFLSATSSDAFFWCIFVGHSAFLPRPMDDSYIGYLAWIIFYPRQDMCDIWVIFEWYTDHVQLSFFADRELLCNPGARFVRTPLHIERNLLIYQQNTLNNTLQHRTTSDNIEQDQIQSNIKHDRTTSSNIIH